MAGPRKRELNRSQTLVPFGVGGIYDFMGESLMACDVSFWGGRGEPVEAKRLAAYLQAQNKGVYSFRAATLGVPFVRFPKWLFCPTCRQMRKLTWKDEVRDEPPRCPNPTCSRHPVLVPMRFVMACSKGHVSDIPWDRWAHRNPVGQKQKSCKSRKLTFQHVKGKGTGLASLEVKCLDCEATEGLGGITKKSMLQVAGFRCSGTQPWKWQDAESRCEGDPSDLRAVQRGASNLYFANVASALDIPPDSDYDPFSEMTRAIKNHHLFNLLVSSPTAPYAKDAKMDLLKAMKSAGFESATPQLIEVIIADEQDARTGKVTPVADPEDLLTAEWKAFLSPRTKRVDERSSFITEHVPMVQEDDRGETATSLRNAVDKVVLGKRLREVRALLGFSRLSPDNDNVDSRLGNTDIDWLPAVEVMGEGMFFSLNEKRVADWERKGNVRERYDFLARRMGDSAKDRFPDLSPRFILLHTLAHALIRELSFSTGYPMASLTERIYSRTGKSGGGPQAGILIYTAQGDMEGTLGGLVRLGRPPHFADVLVKSLARTAWCSSDPVCSDSDGQGMEALNLAACHACALIPETSCQHRNLLLDRMMLIKDDLGFFADVLGNALAARAADAA